MLAPVIREQIVRFGKKLHCAGLVSSASGNLSVLDRERALLAVSPSQMDYEEITPSDVAVLDDAGNLLEGARPSTEAAFHRALYEARPDIAAVVHTHPPYATAISCLHEEIPPVHYLIGFSGDKVPLAPYATVGSGDLAQSVAGAIGQYNAVLLANHGLVTVGPTLRFAFTAAEEIEFAARAYAIARSMGKPVPIPEPEMRRVAGAVKKYGAK